jgi:hypothetical protein
VVTALPLAHTYGTNVMNATPGSGADLILLDRFDAETMLERSARPPPPNATIDSGSAQPALFVRETFDPGLFDPATA